jgi:hypothetical protein
LCFFVQASAYRTGFVELIEQLGFGLILIFPCEKLELILFKFRFKRLLYANNTYLYRKICIIEIEKIRKTIDLKTDTKRMLSYRAIKKGVSLKRYIEFVLKSVADKQEDDILLELSTETEGIVSGQEKSDFVNILHTLR